MRFLPQCDHICCCLFDKNAPGKSRFGQHRVTNMTSRLSCEVRKCAYCEGVIVLRSSVNQSWHISSCSVAFQTMFSCFKGNVSMLNIIWRYFGLAYSLAPKAQSPNWVTLCFISIPVLRVRKYKIYGAFLPSLYFIFYIWFDVFHLTQSWRASHMQPMTKAFFN